MLGSTSQQQRQGGARLELGLFQVGDGNLGRVVGRLLRGEFDRSRHAHREARLDDIEQLMRHITVCVRNGQPLAQRQNLKISVGNAGQCGQRNGVSIRSRCTRQKARRLCHRVVFSPKIEFVAGGEHAGPIEFMAPALRGMTREIGGIGCGIDARKERGSGLSSACVRLHHSCTRRCHIPIMAGRQIHERVQLIAAEIAVPLL